MQIPKTQTGEAIGFVAQSSHVFYIPVHGALPQRLLEGRLRTQQQQQQLLVGTRQEGKQWTPLGTWD